MVPAGGGVLHTTVVPERVSITQDANRLNQHEGRKFYSASSKFKWAF